MYQEGATSGKIGLSIALNPWLFSRRREHISYLSRISQHQPGVPTKSNSVRLVVHPAIGEAKQYLRKTKGVWKTGSSLLKTDRPLTTWSRPQRAELREDVLEVEVEI
jgi:hypothetical protein